MAIQNHIHLAETLEASGEKAPIYDWVASDREKIVVFNANIRRSLTGRPFAHVVKKSGVTVVHFDYTYVVKIEGDGVLTTEEYEDRLNSLAGKQLYLVDHRHCADGADHSSFVTPVFLSQIGNYKADHTLLRYFYVPIYLNDMTAP